ncbi:MAG: TIGR01777 family oxidoreductase [Bacteroidales bacterium]|nr:TIGR01777 family oxidoreductase [Bacteroidales bacterium]MBN2699208.1 TIGR01777 family oxidoreductase [Bacteroidales bacterium]
MKIAIAGHSGFLGSNFIRAYPEHEYRMLSRKQLYADPEELMKAINDAEVILNLTGFPIIKRWTKKNRVLIRQSRAGVNRNLVEAVNRNIHKPAMFISASAIGIYNNTDIHNEKSTAYGSGFLSDVVKEWEESLSLLDNSIKVVTMRTGMVLGKDGGAFPMLEKITRYGIGAVVGSGRQMVSFIHIGDYVRAMDFIMKHKFTGPVNMVVPNPVDYTTFVKTLGKVLNRRIFLRIPEFVVNILLGAASQVITKGQHVVPGRLTEANFTFNYPEPEMAFSNLVGK